ncbi:apolipoprotein N-acyltransferase [Sphingomonas sp. LY29]|uniref:apolipoprotein N-acyltransferase n=1 Tax=Sphingomonas sp. LY29 TaxID=3095341 RepID=UPI002D7922E6|nr:apolipoprotein N-acyltransferase [Sphingomonas sp. LY29]WRP26693.1 apolipoprotein N-acyltransferase [Sphingomonas sp. LY29]
MSAFSFQPYGLWPLMPLALALLHELVARSAGMCGALAIGWGFGLGQFCVGLNWIATAFTFQAAMPAWLGWIAVGLLSLYLAIYPMMAAGLAWRFGRDNRGAMVLALAGGWALTEWLRATMFTGFAWNPVGVALVDTPLIGASRIVGTYGLSALTVLLGGALWMLARKQWRLPFGIAVAGILLAAFPAPSEQAPRVRTTSEDPPGTVRLRPIRIVQPNIGQQDKWREGFEDVASERLTRLSGVRDDVPRLLFWPEAAVTRPLADNRAIARPGVELERRVASQTLGAGDILLTGGLAFTSPDGQVVDSAANSVFVIAPNGSPVGRYDKAHLVPYGEYLPMRPLLSAIGLSRLAPGDIDFAPGPGPQTISLPGDWGRVGFQICYEVIFSGQVVDRRNRPDLIFNPSNDAWFGRWGPPQHLAQARLRAVEEGLPVVRSTPTGISALVDANGRVLASIPWQTEGVIDAVLPATLAPTIFARVGNIIPIVIGFLLLIAAIAMSQRSRYSRT